MNESADLHPFAVLALLCALLLGACGGAPADAPLKGARIGGPFTLTDQNGRRVSDRDFAGKYRLVYLGYTYCPDVCPVDLRVLTEGLGQFERSDPALGAKVQPIFITVDPARDTPAALRQYVAAFHPRLIGLTGGTDEVARAVRSFGGYAQRREGATPGAYLMDHSRNAILQGPDGAPLAIIPHDQGPAGAARELARWVR